MKKLHSKTVCIILLPAKILGSQKGSHGQSLYKAIFADGSLEGSKKLRTVLTEAKYYGQSQQEAKISRLMKQGTLYIPSFMIRQASILHVNS